MNTNRGFIPILAIIIVAVIAVGGGYWVYQEVGGDVDFNLPPIELSNDEGDFVTPAKPNNDQSEKPTGPIACTMEAKICPDGSAVGRTGPKCEFAACPVVSSNIPTGWKEYKNTQFGFRFSYPEEGKLSTFPGNGEILDDVLIEFEDKSSFYNRAAISFQVYKKGVFKQFPYSSKCKIYEKSSKSIGGKMIEIIEQSDCPGSEGSPTGGSGHTLVAIIPLSPVADLVYSANLANSYIKENTLGKRVLDTLNL